MRGGLLASLIVLTAASPSSAQSDWDEPYPPHRIADNLYYVGSKDLASFLVTTSEGHIIINSGFDRTVPLVRKSVERLAQMTDVKVILISHAHNDHAEGLALLKEQTGAAVYVMRGDDQLVRGGAGGGWRACPVSRVLKDGDKVALGQVSLTAHLTAGHTRGCTTWTMQTKDRGKSYSVVIVGSPNVLPSYRLVGNADYPEIAADYARGFAQAQVSALRYLSGLARELLRHAFEASTTRRGRAESVRRLRRVPCLCRRSRGGIPCQAARTNEGTKASQPEAIGTCRGG